MSKICIVTGASRGLGRGIALTLAREEDCKVYATARNSEALNALQACRLTAPRQEGEMVPSRRATRPARSELSPSNIISMLNLG